MACEKSQVILAIGGRTKDATSTAEVYISRDYGMNWSKAYDELQLPKYIPALAYADLVVFDKLFSEDGPDGAPARRSGWDGDACGTAAVRCPGSRVR